MRLRYDVGQSLFKWKQNRTQTACDTNAKREGKKIDFYKLGSKKFLTCKTLQSDVCCRRLFTSYILHLMDSSLAALPTNLP